MFFCCCFLFLSVKNYVAMEIFSVLWLYLANSQVSVYRTIGPIGFFSFDFSFVGNFHRYLHVD